ncbi:unnamed protein product [Arctia plantaginis]|uniref:Uncharacterized protein n=1 Tax=Arctia plantaginis TaxID=874455 RepID=A0A8S0YPW7_ARCPL|nr:unnamed protein product [Arctia plantaginis]
MEGLCRGCLIKYDDPMDILQYTEKYRRLFVYSTGLQVKRNDRITFQVCKDCFLNMKAACKFKKLCRASDKKLKTYLSLKDVGDGVDLFTFIKNSDDTMAFRLPMTSGSSTPAQHNKLRDDDNESTCTSIRNFMTDILEGEEMPDTEARIIREVIEEEADVLDDSLDSHWLQDDVSIDTDFRLDFSLSPFATLHAVNNDHCYTPKRLSEPKEEQLKKYFTSISPARQHRDVNDFTDIIRNNQSEKELCVFGTDEIDSEIRGNNFDMPLIENEEVVNHYVVENEKSIEINIHLPIIEEEKSLNNLDLSSLPSLESLPSFENEKSMNNLDLQIRDHEKSLNSLDLPNFDTEKSINNLDLPSLPSIDNERSLNNLDLLTRLNTPNFYVPTDGTTYVTTSKEIESIINDKKSNKEKPCTIDKNLKRALENKDNKEFSLDELLVSPQVCHEASGASTPTINNILFGDKLSVNNESPSKNSEYLEPSGFKASGASTPTITNILFSDKYSLSKKSPSKSSEYLETNGQVDLEIFEELLQDHTKETHIEDNRVTSDIKHEFKVPKDVDEVDTGTKEIKKYKFSSEFDEGQFDLENFYCNICDKKFESSKAICMHFVKKHKIKIVKKKNKDYKYKLRICNFCGKEYRDLQNFHRHLKKHKTEKDDAEVFKCDKCHLDFTSQSKLEKHKAGHNATSTKKGIGKYVCTVCGATSTTIGNFRLHQRRHTQDYTHICQQCDKGFYRLSEFTIHLRTHTGEKPFSCIYCDKTFARKDVLTKHVKYHMDNKLFKCEHCNKAFVDRSQLNLHMKIAVKCKVKRGILVDKKTLVGDSKAKSNVTKIQDDSKEKEENHGSTRIEDAVTELPYIDTEMSN